jgi:hypothetical protein
MEEPTRFEMTLSAEQRLALDETARAVGLSSADVVRMGIAMAIKRIPAMLEYDPASRMELGADRKSGSSA